MLHTTATLSMLLFVATMLPPQVSAQEVPEGERVMPLLPPPGPYLSSRPQLEELSSAPANGNRIPFVGNLPAMPARYLPRPDLLPTPPPWWRGPVGR